MGFFKRHLWPGVCLLLGPTIVIGGLVLHAYALKDLGLPVEIWAAIGLAIFFLGVIGILMRWDQTHILATNDTPQALLRIPSIQPKTTKTLPLSRETSGIKKVEKISVPDRPDRLYTNLPPQSLRDFYVGRTMAEGDRMLSPHLKKWMRLRGTITDVAILQEYGNSIIWMADGDGLISLSFEKKWLHHVEGFSVGNIIEIDGQIKLVQSHAFQLENCELLQLGNPAT